MPRFWGRPGPFGTVSICTTFVGVAEDFGHDVALRSGLDLSDDGLVLAPTAQVWETLRSSLDLNDFASQLGLRSPVFRADTPTSVFVSWLTRQVDVTGEVTNVRPRHPQLDEHSLYTWCHNTQDDPATLLAMVAVLLLVRRRVGTRQR